MRVRRNHWARWEVSLATSSCGGNPEEGAEMPLFGPPDVDKLAAGHDLNMG